MPVIIDPSDAKSLAVRALENVGVSSSNATSVANALVQAEIDGQPSHGLSRLSAYVEQVKVGKVIGDATPKISTSKPGVCQVNAELGFAFPAMDKLVTLLPAMARAQGIALGAVYRSHHFGQAGFHAERIAKQGCIAMVFSNSPSAIAPWGGHRPLFGTNPIAFACPRDEVPPLVIDMSLSKVARGKVLLARKKGKAIPDDWAIDEYGTPTTCPNAAVKGSMLPIGDAKGAALALMVEVLSASLTGALYGFEASSFFDTDGEPPAIGHAVIAIDPNVTGTHFSERLEHLFREMTDQEDVRLPGEKRLLRREAVLSQGLELIDSLYEELVDLANS
ncbi:Ldh family oxidoreductase [Enterovibrio nigricans]|uniref:(2R)-3-sulfolactate dehydrogenase (NADP+) n=1 Tax=Enterovibrio nigricans DSM 22720 TaxID=1121868 RepID=A0A1T4VCM4_9GAMM|nr:Ldh family oxidoreductase [Enterovibrio nigricans]SKA62705.1 (2R)-3-sulfolactate dehydrogenase (NADP+) [Enterovibrio nigricans DSM 22720]